ncbi:ORF1 protein [Armillaria mellea negative strand RNA virus 2]|uniref:ORF1 protein n=1 Tax=Armillaria mellea negative strand RNA virus 2 TaxID=2803971 RepID=A0A8D9PCQ0_9MONO|nr:ORF1 protein [Armillaria mellea negative strand RNA virus 2]DAD54827.1 TPA_asm: ORF1 protein [Armillaria mellea negative strand RNA virus 2]
MPTRAEKKKRAAQRAASVSAADDPLGTPSALQEWNAEVRPQELVDTLKQATERAKPAKVEQATGIVSEGRSDHRQDLSSPVGRLVQRLADKIDELSDKVEKLTLHSSTLDSKVDKLVMENAGLVSLVHQLTVTSLASEGKVQSVSSSAAFASKKAEFGLASKPLARKVNLSDSSDSDSGDDHPALRPPSPKQVRTEEAPDPLKPVALTQSAFLLSASTALPSTSIRGRAGRARGGVVRGVARGKGLLKL